MLTLTLYIDNTDKLYVINPGIIIAIEIIIEEKSIYFFLPCVTVALIIGVLSGFFNPES
ncbi:hypothetical protein [Brachyspira pilosicoli]|uniref:hypothetical protein n=1 Tax=Brachyspira pilosicoli TaxID=52584 RepID=UPI001CA48113|nr:hypothetical protein [Brachyspira pilosicoli]